MDILDGMGVSKLSAKVFSKVNYSFKMVSEVQILVERGNKCAHDLLKPRKQISKTC